MESLEQKANWEKVNGLLPAIIQDASNGLVLMLGYMNPEALQRTIETSSVWFYSRTREKLWMKGETSGNVLTVQDIKIDCDNDTLLVKASPAGPVCHTGDMTCFKEEAPSWDEVDLLARVIKQRRQEMPEGSYTTKLFRAGIDRIALKVAEEALETVQAGTKETPERLVEESADLIYHLFVLLEERGVSWSDVKQVLGERAGKKPRTETA